MKQNEKDIESVICQYVDQIKEFLSPEIWQNMLLNCSKNELFVLWFIYRNQEVNMTQIAEYIHVPLNTATGIIGRMEKRGLLLRNHSALDKRVVTIALAPKGVEQFQQILGEVMGYVNRVMQVLSPEESKTLFEIMDKIMVVVKEKPTIQKEKKIRKITIE